LADRVKLGAIPEKNQGTFAILVSFFQPGESLVALPDHCTDLRNVKGEIAAVLHILQQALKNFFGLLPKKEASLKV
jgi:hypothetical protein